MKLFKIISSLFMSTMLFSCATLNQGFFPKGDEPSDDAVDVVIDSNLLVLSIDKQETTSTTTNSLPNSKSWKFKSSSRQLQNFQIAPGVHVFQVQYADSQKHTGRITTIANLEKENAYKITSEITGAVVKIDVINTETMESVKLDMPTLQGDRDDKFISRFIKGILNPTMEGTDKTVIEENDEFRLVNLPGMKYELTEKATGKTQKGFRGFTTDFTFKSGKVFLYETDSISTKDEFLKTDYQKTSGIIFEVTGCTNDSVTYKYLAPADKEGTSITFKFSVKE